MAAGPTYSAGGRRAPAGALFVVRHGVPLGGRSGPLGGSRARPGTSGNTINAAAEKLIICSDHRHRASDDAPVPLRSARLVGTTAAAVPGSLARPPPAAVGTGRRTGGRSRYGAPPRRSLSQWQPLPDSPV